MIASSRSRNRSVLPDDRRDGRIAKTPENGRRKPQYRHFPILQHPWESLENNASSPFSGPTNWSPDLLFISISNSGLSAVTIFSRLVGGAYRIDMMKPRL